MFVNIFAIIFFLFFSSISLAMDYYVIDDSTLENTEGYKHYPSDSRYREREVVSLENGTIINEIGYVGKKSVKRFLVVDDKKFITLTDKDIKTLIGDNVITNKKPLNFKKKDIIKVYTNVD